MKALFLTLALALTSTFAQAAVEQPQPAIDPVVRYPVAEYQSAGGMPVPGGDGSYTMTLMNDGSAHVVLFRYPKLDDNGNLGAPTKIETDFDQVIASDTLGKLMQVISHIKGGPLTKNEDEPQCMDAPGYVYTVFRGTKRVVVEEIMNCVDHQLVDRSQRPAASKIRAALDLIVQNLRK